MLRLAARPPLLPARHHLQHTYINIVSSFYACSNRRKEGRKNYIPAPKAAEGKVPVKAEQQLGNPTADFKVGQPEETELPSTSWYHDTGCSPTLNRF